MCALSHSVLHHEVFPEDPHISLVPGSPNSVGWDELCTGRASLCQGPAQSLQQGWEAGPAPAAGNEICLGPNLVPLTADMK